MTCKQRQNIQCNLYKRLQTHYSYLYLQFSIVSEMSLTNEPNLKCTDFF